MEQRTVLVLGIILAISFVAIQHSAAKCNACNSNGIACVNATSFYMCFNGILNTDNIYTCPTGNNCTSLSLRCAPYPAECSASEGCGSCDGRKMFTCTSRNTFAQCNGTQLMPQTTGNCPIGLTCDSSQNEICVEDCMLSETIECDRPTPL